MPIFIIDIRVFFRNPVRNVPSDFFTDLLASKLQRACLLQLFLHSRPALPRGFLGCASATPVSFQADREVVAIALQRFELTNPIDDASAHGRPSILAVWLLHGVLAMTMANALFRQ